MQCQVQGHPLPHHNQHESSDCWSRHGYKGLALLMETKTILKDHFRWGWLSPCCDDITAQLLCLTLLLSPRPLGLLERADSRKLPMHTSSSYTLILGHQPARKCHVFPDPLLAINVLLRCIIWYQFRNSKSHGSTSISICGLLHSCQNKQTMATHNHLYESCGTVLVRQKPGTKDSILSGL